MPTGSAAGRSPTRRSGAGADFIRTSTPITRNQGQDHTTGDFHALLDTVHPDSRWTYYGANPRRPQAEFRGRDAVRKFFEGIAGRLAITAFDRDELLVDGDTLVVFGSEEGTVKATGQPFRNVWSQKYVVKDGGAHSVVSSSSPAPTP